MKTTFIYGLIDPDTNDVRYIGKSDDPDKRLDEHLSFVEPKPTHKQRWLKSLVSKDKQPIVFIVEEVSISEWEIKEKYWIKYYRDLGYKLTNSTDGGEGGNTGLSEDGRKRMSEKARTRMVKAYAELQELEQEMEINANYEQIDTGNGFSYKY